MFLGRLSDQVFQFACSPENRTRLPFELACSPSPASITPAFTSSSLYLPILARISVLGRMPASETLLALTITITRIALTPCSLDYGLDSRRFFRLIPAPTVTSNRMRRNRQGAVIF